MDDDQGRDLKIYKYIEPVTETFEPPIHVEYGSVAILGFDPLQIPNYVRGARMAREFAAPPTVTGGGLDIYVREEYAYTWGDYWTSVQTVQKTVYWMREDGGDSESKRVLPVQDMSLNPLRQFKMGRGMREVLVDTVRGAVKQVVESVDPANAFAILTTFGDELGTPTRNFVESVSVGPLLAFLDARTDPWLSAPIAPGVTLKQWALAQLNLAVFE